MRGWPRKESARSKLCGAIVTTPTAALAATVELVPFDDPQPPSVR